MKKKCNSKTETVMPVSCEINGEEFNRVVKQLKVAFPRKKSASIIIYGLSEGLNFGLPGADVLATAKVSTEFRVEISWPLIVHTLKTRWKDDELIKFEFSDNFFSVNSVGVRSPGIIFQSGIVDKRICNDASSQEGKLNAYVEDTPVIVDPMESAAEPPLRDAYVYIKKYGFRPFLENSDFVSQKNKVKRALDKASKILAPIGITRMDIEQMIDEKITKMPGYKTDTKK